MSINRKVLYLLLFTIFVSCFPFEAILCQERLDYEVMLKKVKHSSENTYKECIKEYDTYLKKYPDNVSIQIEKCKFILYAQYDEQTGSNPNQADFDSCSAILINRFPNHPEVFIFQTTYKWEDELEEVFANAERSISQNREDWDSTNLATLYKAMADEYYYYNENNMRALACIKKAILYDKEYKYTIEHAGILAEAGKNEEALKILRSMPDSTKTTWQLFQKASLFLELEEYTEALAIYKRVKEKDSTYTFNITLASTLEEVGEYEQAREYLVAHVSESSNKENALRTLLRHDLRYQDGDKCISSYNEFRDLGYSTDPIALYRLKLFFLHPSQPWSFRDILGLLSFLLVFVILIVIPYIWILPIYFIGHHWGFMWREKPFPSFWGLKAFWFISAGYLISSFLSSIAEPEALYYMLNPSNYEVDIAAANTNAVVIISMAGIALFGFASMYKVNPLILLSTRWSIRKSILCGIGAFVLFKVVTGFYIKQSGAANISSYLFASIENIQPIISTFGRGVSLLILGLIVPVYEEIMFRGVILDSCQRYLNFNAANIIQSLIFALIHMNFILIPVYFLFGIATGYLRKESGGLLSGIVFHALNNILVLLALFVLDKL